MTNLGGVDQAYDAALQPDGKIVVVGCSGTDTAIARYLSNGQLDLTFGGTGTGYRVDSLSRARTRPTALRFWPTAASSSAA